MPSERDGDPWDECECGHDREEHDIEGDPCCNARASSGHWCSYPSFKGPSDADEETPK